MEASLATSYNTEVFQNKIHSNQWHKSKANFNYLKNEIAILILTLIKIVVMTPKQNTSAGCQEPLSF